MFNFLKNWFSKDDEQLRTVEDLKNDLSEESTIAAKADEHKEQSESSAAANDAAAARTKAKVRTELSLHPVWEQSLDSEKKYTLRFLQEELQEMPDGTVGVTGFSMIPQEGGITVALFFRNGTPSPIGFESITLSLVLDDKLFARQAFDLSAIGSIPAYSSRPWEVFFPETSFVAENISFSRWKVLLYMGKRLYSWPKTLDLDPEMEKRMSDRQKAKLEYLAENLPLIPKEQVQITAFDISKMKDGGLFVGLLFRNGKALPYAPDTLNIRVTDAHGDTVASGLIETKGKVEVKPSTSRPWLIVFPPNAVKKADADLSDWQLHVK